ncbi:Protein PEP-RELATED DEVELOPMENT ARRESTED 1, chloroplastic [Glycine max]|nr:Protein PEP-RELATED DEVELOPMENT ARRESTED 1, chloroplastic [Glycine max]
MFVTSLACSYFTYPTLLHSFCSTFTSSYHQCTLLQLNRNRKKYCIWASINGNSAYEVGGGYPELEQNQNGKLHSDMSSQREALLRGGDQVISVLEEIITLNTLLVIVISVGEPDSLAMRHRYSSLPYLEDMNMDEESEKVAVELAAQGVIGKRVDEMESDFMMALDYMIQLAENDQDDKRKSLLEVIKETVLSHLTKKCPPHVQVIGLLCRTPKKESRHELLRRVAAGGGVFKGENELKMHIPAANLNDIANQADDLLEAMETRPVIPDRKLLARLVLIREEARNMMGGGITDERNHRGFYTLPQPEVDFLAKLVALKPGKNVLDMIRNVMQGKDEGADKSGNNDEDDTTNGDPAEFLGRPLVTGEKTLPVRPGMFLETVSKVLSGLYAGTDSGITAQHLEWVYSLSLYRFTIFSISKINVL